MITFVFISNIYCQISLYELGKRSNYNIKK